MNREHLNSSLRKTDTMYPVCICWIKKEKVVKLLEMLKQLRAKGQIGVVYKKTKRVHKGIPVAYFAYLRLNFFHVFKIYILFVSNTLAR